MRNTNRIRRISAIIAIFFTILIPITLGYNTVFADSSLSGYTALAPIPGISDSATLSAGGSSSTTTVSTVLKGVFVFAIGFSAAAAVFMIVLGGIQYMSTDSITGKRTGKDRIQKALLGLAIVISSWVILNTINPKILSLSFGVDANAPASSFSKQVPANNGKCAYVVGDCRAGNPQGDPKYLCIYIYVSKGGDRVANTGQWDCSQSSVGFEKQTLDQKTGNCPALKNPWLAKTPDKC